MALMRACAQIQPWMDEARQTSGSVSFWSAPLRSNQELESDPETLPRLGETAHIPGAMCKESAAVSVPMVGCSDTMPKMAPSHSGTAGVAESELNTTEGQR